MITVPESVLAYQQQSDVTIAVDLLLETDKAPIAKLGWDDVASYYRACLAAQQTRVEFALFLEGLWRAIWRDAPSPWRSIGPGKPVRNDMSIDLDTVWHEGCFSRAFEQPGYKLELSVSLNAGKIQLGFALWNNDDDNLLEAERSAEWEQEDSDYLWTQPQIVSFSEAIDPAPFKPWTEHAWATVATALKG